MLGENIALVLARALAEFGEASQIPQMPKAPETRSSRGLLADLSDEAIRKRVLARMAGDAAYD